MLEQLPIRELEARGAKGETVTVLVDGDYDGEYFAEHMWRVLPSGYVFRTSYAGESGTRKMVYLHRLVASPPPGGWVRHKDGNKLNNRSCNLEIVSPSQSAAIRAMPKRDGLRTSKYRGVVRIIQKRPTGAIWYGRWVAQLHKGKDFRYSYCDTEEEAARAYDAQAKIFWGDKARLNFPEGVKGE